MTTVKCFNKTKMTITIMSKKLQLQ